MRASDFWARCGATVFVLSAAVGGVIVLYTQAVPPPLFFYVSGVFLGLCISCAIIASIWE